jgi:hypothetical protein
MRAYLVDEIDPADMGKITGYLREAAISSSMEKVYWLQIPNDLLSETQSAHTHCQPHVFAVELGRDWVKLEFFSRSLKGIGCSCQGYCTEPQTDYVIRFAHEMLKNLGIRT